MRKSEKDKYLLALKEEWNQSNYEKDIQFVYRKKILNQKPK